MMICGACERELPGDSYSQGEGSLRQSIRRCKECVAAGNVLSLMKKGRTRSEEDDCPICSLPLPLDGKHSSVQLCCMKLVCTRKRGMRNCPFCRTPTSYQSQAQAMVQRRVDAGDPRAIYNLGTQYQFGERGLEKDVTRAVKQAVRARR